MTIMSPTSTVAIDTSKESELGKVLAYEEGTYSEVENPHEEELINESDHKQTADLLLESAKEEGFLEALVHLANGDFEDSQNYSDETSSDVLELEFETDDLETIENEEQVIDPQKEELLVRIDQLESQVADVLTKNEKLNLDLQKANERADLSQETLMAMFYALYELAKKEEDEKKKIGLFETLIELVSQFMLTVIDPEGEFNKKEENDSNKTEKEPVAIEKIMQFLKNKNSKNTTTEMTKDTPIALQKAS